MRRSWSGLRFAVACATALSVLTVSGGAARASGGTVTIGGQTFVTAGGSDVAFDVTLSAPSASPVTVTWGASRDTAVPTQNGFKECTNGDYGSDRGGTLTFQPGQVEKHAMELICGVAFQPVNTSIDFHVYLVAASVTGGYSVSDHASDLGTITAPDCYYFCNSAVSIGDASIGEGVSGTRFLNLVVALDNPSSSALSVDYAVTSGTATCGPTHTGLPIDPGTDCAANGTKTLQFPLLHSGVTAIQKAIRVAIFPDSTNTGDETFTVTLSNARNADGAVPINKAVGTGTIIDDN